MDANVLGAYNSNLSQVGDGDRRFDMVVAVTQESVSATMKLFLDKVELEPFKQVFVINKDATGDEPKFVPADLTEILEQLGFDPFTVPRGLEDDDERITKMARAGVILGFSAEFGLPDVDLSRIPDPIYFDQSGSVVTYNMITKQFQAFQVARGDGLYDPIGIQVVSQSEYLDEDPEHLPWTFKFSVDLDLRTDSCTGKFHLLPQRTQDLVKNLGPDMFSIQQLFLDLNAAKLQNTGPKLPNIDSQSTLAILLQTVFLGAYLKTIDAKGDGILLGYSAISSHPIQHETSLIPTNFNFHMSPYKNLDGTNTDNFPLYTLNYLVVSENRPLPAPQDFIWNWVAASESNDFHGACSIRRDVFRDFISGILSPELSLLVLKPSVTVNAPNPFIMYFSWSIDPCRDPQRYTSTPAGGDTKVLSFVFHEKASDSDTFVPIWGDMSLSVTSSSDVYFDENLIKTASNIVVHGYVNVEGGVTKGNLVRYTVSTTYELGVDAHGELTVKLQAGSPDFQDLSDDIDVNGWSQFISAGTVNNLVDKIVHSVRGRMESFLTSFGSRIRQRLNGHNMWVFPGGNTFSFKDVRFSEHGDLVSHVTYVDPEQ